MEMSNFEEEAENIFPDWFKSIDWRRWDAPLNLTIGESRRNDAIAALAGAPRRHGYLIPVTATLLRDSNNPVDRNAIKVEIQTVQVGYVRHEVAFHLAPIFDSDNARTCEVAAIIRGETVDAWIRSGNTYPSFISTGYVVTLFERHGFSLVHSFLNRYGEGHSEYLVFSRSSKPPA
jgi:hypothetical protein